MLNFYRRFLKFFGIDYTYFINERNFNQYLEIFKEPYNLAKLLLFSECPFSIITVIYAFYFNKKFIPFAVWVIIYQTYLGILKVNTYSKKNDSSMVHLIQSNHLQSLKELLEHNPECAKNTYKNKSMLYWCKHYNNVQAHTMIVEFLKMCTN